MANRLNNYLETRVGETERAHLTFLEEKANGKLPHQPFKKPGTDINSEPAVNGWIKGRQINLKGKNNIRYTV
ncbi:hypothetical protein NC652_013253 [Populus alba x Populus x berolinensis]|uniref:Uncharacterized protein n=1 Tax=Populus alba x Populus x berolinensis TaxID=444605 RepID=A0AAD6QTW3_9ROSI|nr:hypothetical protein NC652_013253 [Populus alba x Populus x berolinensis]KAJ6996546.1 hypothetical protein NC653_013216 [Populus alba x Populus x berolinensis]